MHAESCEVISLVPSFSRLFQRSGQARLVSWLLHPAFWVLFTSNSGAAGTYFFVAASSGRLDEHEPSRHTPTHVHTPPHHITSICHNPGGDPNRFIRCPASSGDDWSIRAVPFRSFPLLLLPCAQRHYYDSFLYYIHRIVCAKTPHCSEYFF